ncbi:hypothetical protein ACOSQ2_032466 [Xanthoceras sorbifolium]
MDARPSRGEIAEALICGRMDVRLPSGEAVGTIAIAQTEKSEAETKKLREELEAARKEAQLYKDKLASKMELEKKLANEVRRCQSLRKEIKQEMNASKAKYKGQIHGLKDQVEKVTVDLEYVNKLVEQQAGDPVKKDKELAQKDRSLEECIEAIQDEAYDNILYNVWVRYPDLDFNFLGLDINK